jgi:rod shape-determining protein MreC
MNRYKKSKLIVVVSVLSVFSLSLLFLTAYQGLEIPVLTSGARQAVSFFGNAVSRPTQFLSKQKEYLTDLISAYKENQELKSTLVDLENDVSEMESLKNENESLRKNLEMKEQHADKHFFSALVSERSPHSWNQKLMLNIGQDDGLTTDMLVVANGALIGTIDSLDGHSTTVKLLTNSDEFSKIPVKIALDSTDVYGILSSYDTDSHSFLVNQLNSNVEIPAGSSVVTSDLAGGTPSNIPIGKVISVKTSSSNLNRELYITPTANFSNIYAAMVVGQ